MTPEMSAGALAIAGAVIILREVLSFIRERRNGGSGKAELLIVKVDALGASIDKLNETIGIHAKMIEDLWAWHNKETETGRKVWYVTQVLEDAVVDLGPLMVDQSRVLSELRDEMKKRGRS